MPRKKIEDTTPDAAAPKPRTRTPKPVEAPIVTPEPAKKEKAPPLFKRSTKPATAATPPAPAQQAAAPAPTRERRPARTKAEPKAAAKESVPAADEEIAISFRPLSGGKPRADVPKAAAPASPQDGPTRNRRSPRVKPEAKSEAKPTVSNEPRGAAIDTDEDLPVLVWRSRETDGKARQKPTESQANTDDTEGDSDNRRRSKRRGKKLVTAADALTGEVQRREPKPAPEPEPVVAIAPRPEPPVLPQREPIAIPDDAPQIAVLNGVTTIVRGQRAYTPHFFFGSALDEERAANVFDQIKNASQNGIHLFIHLVEFSVDPAAVNDSVAFAAFMLKRTREIDPEAQVMFRVVLTAPDGWERHFPKAKYRNAFGELAEPSFCDDEFWNEASEMLQSFIRKLRKLDTDQAVLGLHLERGEWFFANGSGYDTSDAARVKFRDWLRVRYRNDVVALRASWFDGRLDFDNLVIPVFGGQTGEDFVRTDRKSRRWVDYHLFLSDSTVNRIQDLAYDVKKASEGYYLVGVSYGYTYEWSHAASGHLSLGKLLRAREVDIIAGPPSYKSREAGGTCPFPGPVDSFSLNGKLYLSEEDFKTPMSGKVEPDDFNPVIRTPQALENVQWRGAGAALAHNSGICWMDLWGNGWLGTPGIWSRGGKTQDTLTRRLAAHVSEPDVAVFIDERSLAYLADPRAFELLVQNVREAVLRSGLSAGFYLLSDLAHRENFPESKVYVFMNAWDLRPEVRSAIKTRLQRDNKVLFWLYAAGLFDGGRESLERVREVTGIALKPQPFASKSGTTLLNRRHPLGQALPDRQLGEGSQLEPSYFAIPEDSMVLGEYTQTGLPSFVAREFRHEDPSQSWTSVFLGEPVVTPALFRALGEMAGAQAWNYHDDVVHVRPPFLTVHCTKPGPRSLTLPDKWAAYSVTGEEWATLEQTHLRFSAMEGSTHMFLVGPRPELEAMLQEDPADLLKVTELPPKPDNTVDMETGHFDISIMRLDEWVEEGWSDDMEGDFLIKPSQLDIEAPEDLVEVDTTSSSGRTSGRRRRRRRGPNGNDKGGPPAPDAGSINVVFRKRV
jgi:hypothetical protein